MCFRENYTNLHIQDFRNHWKPEKSKARVQNVHKFKWHNLVLRNWIILSNNLRLISEYIHSDDIIKPT